MSRRVLLCPVTEVPDNTPKQVFAEGQEEPLALYRVNGNYYLTDDLCTHGLASLSDGDLEGTTIICPLHGGAFDIRTGAAIEYPCTRPLRTYPVDVEDDHVYGMLA